MIAKHVFDTWIESGSLREEDLVEIDKRMKDIKIPSDLGRIPNGISQHWKNFKADEWKHWTLIYSYYCLREVLSTAESTLLCLFANACRLLCKYITEEENDQAHHLLRIFCNKFQELYGKLGGPRKCDFWILALCKNSGSKCYTNHPPKISPLILFEFAEGAQGLLYFFLLF